MLYHYTSLDTFKKIMGGVSEINDQSYVKLRMSRLDKVNDPTEMGTDVSLLKELIEHDEVQRHFPICGQILNRINTNNIEELNKRLKLEKEEHIPYVLCLSKKKDFLPMWHLYGDKLCGVCLCFANDIFDHVIKENEKAPMITGDVTYSKYHTSDALKLSLSLFNDINQPEQDKPIEEIIQELYIMVSPFLKHEAYSYEKEFRVCVHNYQSNNKTLTVYNRRMDCVYIWVPLSSLKKVYHGADMPENNRKKMEKFCTKYNIKIEKSGIPYKQKK